MDKTLTLYQVYFKDEQLPELYQFATPYKNHWVTDYFENSVIADLVPMCDSDLISVCSWRLRKKRGEGGPMLALRGDTALTKEKILSTEFDVAILTPRSPNHRPLSMAKNWHGKTWIEAFEALRPFFREKNIRFGDELTNTIYENHFVAKKDIYHEYVSECLMPCMEFMEGKEAFNAVDTAYPKVKSNGETKALVEVLGHSWTIAPFILERLFSIWIERKNLSVVRL